MANYRFGIIGGAGGQARSWAGRLKKWANLDGNQLELIAMADIDEIGLKSSSEKFNCKGYKNYVEMLDKEKLDAVIIATPHFLHAPMIVAAAEHGINVLGEKPMCINLKQADAIKAAVDKAKIKYAVGFQHRFNPLYAGLKNAITSGDLGEIFQINMLFHWYRKEDYYLNSSPVPENKDENWEGWRGHWKTEGAGALANQIIHFMDVFQWLSPSPIQSVMAASRVAKHTLVETDDNTNAIVEFKNGSMGFIQAGVAYEHDKVEEYDIFGLKGSLIRRNKSKGIFGIQRIYEDYRSNEIKKKKSTLKYLPKLADPSKLLLSNFINAIKTDNAKSISVDAVEGRKSVELMRGILLSVKNETKIKFPFDDPAEEFPKLQHTYVDPKYKDLV